MAALGEFELIRRYFAAAASAAPAPGVALGIGDDCALLQLGPGEQLAVSTDSQVAGVHFPEDPDPFLLASACWLPRPATWRRWAPHRSVSPWR